MWETEEVVMYAIQNVKTGNFVCGTDYRYHPHHQRTSSHSAILYETRYFAEVDFRCRGCGKDYQIVPVKLVVVEEEQDDEAETV
jgi:hypothetical protein